MMHNITEETKLWMQADEGMVSFARTNAHSGLIVTSGVTMLPMGASKNEAV